MKATYLTAYLGEQLYQSNVIPRLDTVGDVVMLNEMLIVPTFFTTTHSQNAVRAVTDTFCKMVFNRMFESSLFPVVSTNVNVADNDRPVLFYKANNKSSTLESKNCLV